MHTTDGVSRRDLLRRGAAVGAMTWAMPVVQSVSSPAWAAETPAPREARELSNISLVLECDDGNGGTQKYFVKYEDGSGWERDPGCNPCCDCYQPADRPAQGRNGGTSEKADGGDLGLSVVEVSGSRWLVIVPPSCTVIDGAGFAGNRGGGGPPGCSDCFGPDAVIVDPTTMMKTVVFDVSDGIITGCCV